MAAPTIFDACRPRPDVLTGSVAEADFAADLAAVISGRGSPEYCDPARFFASMAEAESVSARKATLLDPTAEDETVQVLRRRLFEHVDDAQAAAAVDAYCDKWAHYGGVLPADAARPETAQAFRVSYPLHPEVLATLTGKTATLGNFQRVRGMLRLLARTIAQLWRERPADATAVHLHHVDLGHEPIRQEIVTRLGQAAYLPAIANDIAAPGDGAPALAQQIDAANHGGLPPYGAYVARTIFMHTLAFNEPLKGLPAERLRYSLLGPATEVTFIDDARTKLLLLGLLFRALAPMRNRAHMRAVAAGIEEMEPEEAAYWAGMAIHRPHPRRVLMALRILLTDADPASA